MLKLDATAGILSDDAGHIFDPVERAWRPSATPPRGERADLMRAVIWLQRDSAHAFTIPVGVIGPRDATPTQSRIAERIGSRLARMGLTIVCGGREGVMEAVCRGVAVNGGTSVGLLPEGDPATANPHVTIPIATGIGEARNLLVARSAFCLIAIGNSYGTLSEVALGLQFGKPVFGIEGAAQVEGVRHYESVDELTAAVARLVLALPV